MFNRGRAYDKVVENLKKADANIDYSHGKLENNYKTTQQTDQPLRCISTYTLLALENGVREQTIISDNLNHYGNIHPTQKPVRLLERLLALVIPESKPREEIVVADFFGGSMSCMEAVYNMGMKGIACEIDQEYFEKGKERIENYSRCNLNYLGSGFFNLGSMEKKEIIKTLRMFFTIEIIIYLLFSFYWIDISPRTWSLESRAFFASISSGGVLLMCGLTKIIDN